MTSLMRGGSAKWVTHEWLFFSTRNSLSCEWLWVTIIIEWLFWQWLLSDIIEYIFWSNFMSDYYWVILSSTFSEAILWVTIIEWYYQAHFQKHFYEWLLLSDILKHIFRSKTAHFLPRSSSLSQTHWWTKLDFWFYFTLLK